MTLPSSFPLSASQINVELGRAPGAAFSITGSAERGLAGVLSGNIAFSDFLGKSASTPSSVTFIETNGGTGTITGVNFGAAAADRIIVLAVHWIYADGVHHTITGATIGGVSATVDIQIGHTGGSTGLGSAIVHAVVPTGTSGSVAISFSLSTTYSIGVYSLRGMGSATPTDTKSTQSTGSTGDLTVNLSVASGGVMIAAHTISTGGTPGVDWSGITGRYELTRVAGAMSANQSAGTKVITADVSTTLNAGNALATASWA